jgi:hypothetical protein
LPIQSAHKNQAKTESKNREQGPRARAESKGREQEMAQVFIARSLKYNNICRYTSDKALGRKSKEIQVS